MAYSKAFTPQQRREATRALRSYKMHLRLLRRKYAPEDAEQLTLLEEYIAAVADVETLLAKSDRAVNVIRLNQVDVTARWLAI